jgi:hypothetical protein
MSFWKKSNQKAEEPVDETVQSTSEDLGHEIASEVLEANESPSVDVPTLEVEAGSLAPEVEVAPLAPEVDPSAQTEVPAAQSDDVSSSEAKEEVMSEEPAAKTEEELAAAALTLEEEMKREREAAEEQLRLELEEASNAALNAQLEFEQQEFLEDLSVLDGRILPELKVPDWREELEFVKERYEPCDLSDHIVKVSKRRQTARQIDHELAESRLSAYQRYLERASRRFKDKIDEDALLNDALKDLTIWRNDQGKTVAWKLADRINQEVLKAKQAETEATSFVENNIEFVNPAAVKVYRDFARRAWLIPIVTLYITSVVGLTYNRFEWIMKFFPFFNLGLSKTLIMISGIAAAFWISNLWKYSKKVAKIQKQLIVFTAKHEEQHLKIVHAVKQHTRLAQQQPLVEPILEVLAKAYRVQIQSDVSARAQVTTHFDPAVLPACVTLARAVDSDEVKMGRLRRRALSVLMSPGWRTNGLDEIARIHADSRMLDASALSLKSLDTDSVVSASNAQRLLTEAFSNSSIHQRVSKARLVRAIKDLHKEVLANWASTERPKVVSMRDDGFDKIAFQSSWLVDEDVSEDWIEFLSEVLNDETAPFGHFNILDRRSELNDAEKISSMAVVPHYFDLTESKLKIEKSKTTDVMPMDIVVRVDVSPWADPSAFTIFANDQSMDVSSAGEVSQIGGGATSD